MAKGLKEGNQATTISSFLPEGTLMGSTYKIRTKKGAQNAAASLLKVQKNFQFGGPESELSSEIAMALLQFDMGAFRKYLRLSPRWYHLILSTMDEWMNKAENDFVMKNSDHLFFKKSYTSSQIINFCGRRGLRVDRILQCEIISK